MDTEYQIAKATLAQYVRETAKAQIAVDRYEGKEHLDIELESARKRLALCKAKAREPPRLMNLNKKKRRVCGPAQRSTYYEYRSR